MLLRELLDEVATGDEPPSRLTADEIYAAGQRRRRTTAVARIGTAAALVIALVAALVVFAPARAPDPAVGPAVALEIRAIGGYDKDHLYAVVLPCGDRNCDPELHGTRDGGRTWTNRGTIADVNLPGAPSVIHVSRDGAVGVFGSGTVGGGPAWILSTSIDRGRSFAGVMPGDPVDAAAPGALVACGYPPPVSRCVVEVYDLDAGTAGPLATQPGVVVLHVTRAPDGTIWALGRDAAAGLPAIARSTDGGRTWSTHLFTGAPEFTADYRPLAGKVTAVDGTVVVTLAYAPFANPPQTSNVGFRLRDGDWQRLDTDVFQPGAMAVGASYLAADGTFVIQKIATDASVSSPAPPVSPSTTPWSSGGPAWSSGPPAPPPSGGPMVAVPRIVQFWICPPGGTGFHRIDPPTGLPDDQLSAVDRLPGGGYLAHSFTGAWVSDDGRTWKQLAIR